MNEQEHIPQLTLDPEGAAAAAALRTEAALPERFSIKAIGMGAGKSAYDTPGILRAMIIEPAE